jgi:hypothetical protein
LELAIEKSKWMYSKLLTGALVSADPNRPYSNNLSEIPEGANDYVGKTQISVEPYICGHPVANSDVPDLHSRITKHIPPALSYAWIFWGNHLDHVAFEHDLFAKLESFFETKFLFWVEVLSLTSLALRALSSLLKWLPQEVRTPHD